MSNRVDVFKQEQGQLAIGSASLSVLVDGLLCPYVEVKEIVRGEWPEFGWARLSYNQAAYPQTEAIAIEDIEASASVPRFSKSWITKDPSARWLLVQSAVLLALHQADAFGTIKVLA